MQLEHLDPLPTHRDIDLLVDPTILLVSSLLQESQSQRTRHDEANRRRFARLLKNPDAIALTMSLTDEVMRMTSVPRAARTFRRISKLANVEGLGLIDYIGIKIASPFSKFFPGLVMKIVNLRVRMAANGIILPAEEALLSRHITKRVADHARLNINVLGEAVLGDHEAAERLKSVMAMVARPEVNYASVKISSVTSQLITVDYQGSVKRVSDGLRLLYREAQKHGTFINLDMEEFRDLSITVEVFMKLLDESEFESMTAGIVLQAYLPESHAVFAQLVAWSKRRHERTGASIKIRLVKGANLAMEKAEAELHGWVAAPYDSKAAVDASYARLIDTALDPAHFPAVRIGIASHNLFHLAWAIQVAKSRKVLAQLDIEMLEGMANAEALAVVHEVGNVLLYTPVTRHDDFPAAVAYLVRRLDENTSLENYLRASFDMTLGNKSFEDQKKRFLDSVTQRHSISTQSRRHGLPPHDCDELFARGIFENESDADSTNPIFQSELEAAWEKLDSAHEMHLPLVINGKEILTESVELGHDPSNEGKTWYRYSVANADQIDLAVATAQASFQSWEDLGAVARGAILGSAATIMESERAETIAIMALDSGKTISEADPEVSEAIDFARYYALSAQQKEQGSKPLGVVLIVPPWNFPYAIPMGGVCSALAAGNAVILKPAPETVATAWKIAQQLWEAGVPKSVLQFVPTRDDEDGKHLVTHKGVNGVILTGGFETAALFTSWKPEIRLMAETSGKNAILISASADIDSAVKDLVQSAFGHAGQKCSAASLAIVETSIYENPSFFRQLKDAVESLSVGAGRNYSTSTGPIIRPAGPSLHRALTQLDSGESWLIQPRQIDSSGHMWSPGVKLGVKPGSWSHRNEWFGPVLAIMHAPDFETAIDWQNATDFGLTAGVHALDEKECELWISRIEAGNLYVNRGTTGAVVNRQPFGGWKRSSVGPTSKAGGANYLNNLRNWDSLTDLSELIESSSHWWDAIGSKAIDASGLLVERNYQLYKISHRTYVVRIDESTSLDAINYIHWVGEKTGSTIEFSTERENIRVAHATVESVSDLAARLVSPEKVRWLSNELLPASVLLNKGISADTRPIAARGDVELPRWVLEQSVSITNHRYGNVGAGPRPRITME